MADVFSHRECMSIINVTATDSVHPLQSICTLWKETQRAAEDVAKPCDLVNLHA